MENTNKTVEVVENTEVVTIPLFDNETGYRDLATAAREYGIHYVGVPKVELVEKLNAHITKINNGEIEVPVPVAEEEEDEITSGDTEGTEAPTQRAPRTPAAPRVKAPKWFEEDGAFPYQDGDVVEIVSGKDLIGRLVKVKQPSAKKNALKGHLIHPVTGQLQKTFLSVDFDRIELRERDGQPVDTQEVTEEEAI